MKRNLILAVIFALSVASYGQGLATFANNSSTLILTEGTPMPVSGTQEFIFAVFLAPPTTVSSTNLTASDADPVFQAVSAYNTNSATLPGRIVTRFSVDMGLGVGAVVDFVVRGWSANAGTTWDEARTTWNDGKPSVPMFIGSSVIGNDLVFGGGGISNSPVVRRWSGTSAGLQYDIRARTIHAHAGWTWFGGNVAIASALALIPAPSTNDPLDEMELIARLAP